MISEQLHRMRAHVWIIHYNCFMKFYNTKPILFHKKLIHSLDQHHSNSRSSHHTLGSSKILALAPLPILVSNELLYQEMGAEWHQHYHDDEEDVNCLIWRNTISFSSLLLHSQFLRPQFWHPEFCVSRQLTQCQVLILTRCFYSSGQFFS